MKGGTKLLDREIRKIALPNIIANISIPLLGIVDTALMGRLGDPVYIGAIAVGSIIFNILYWGLGFLRPGTTGLTAQAYGKEDIRECYRLFWRSTLIGLGFGLLILILHKPLGNACFSLLSASESVEELALQYFSIRVLAAPAVIMLMAMRGWFFGMQDAISPMILTISTNVLNIIISWHLVVNQDMGVIGVARGTMIAQWISLGIFLMIIIYKHRKDVILYFDKSILQFKEMTRFAEVNRDMFIRNIGMILVFSYFTDYSSQVNDDYLAINQMLLQLFYFTSYAVDGFAYASESLVGKYLGALKLESVYEVIKKCLTYGLGLGMLFAILYLFIGKQFLSLMTTNVALINAAQPYLIWLALVSVVGALAFIWDGVYSGATASKELRDSMCLSVIIFFAVHLSLKSTFPTHAIWVAMMCFMLGRSLFQWILFRSRIKDSWETLD